MRIVFMGTPDFAVPCLQALLQQAYEVVGVFTQPDKPKGRGYKMIPPPVKAAAVEAGLPCISRFPCEREKKQNRRCRPCRN